MKFYITTFLQKALILLLSTILISSCANKECRENNTGDLKLINKSDNQIEVNFNDTEVFTMEPGDEISKTLEPGDYTADVKFSEFITLGYTVPRCEMSKKLYGV